MEITKISSKGQVVIPRKIRSELGINKDSILAFEKVNDIIIIKKMDEKLIDQFEKSLKDVKQGKIKRVV